MAHPSHEVGTDHRQVMHAAYARAAELMQRTCTRLCGKVQQEIESLTKLFLILGVSDFVAKCNHEVESLTKLFLILGDLACMRNNESMLHTFPTKSSIQVVLNWREV